MTQEERVLEKLKQANGEWVNGNQVFLREMFLTQYHRAIFNLQRDKKRYNYEGEIEASDFKDEFGFKSYRLAAPKEWRGVPIFKPKAETQTPML